MVSTKHDKLAKLLFFALIAFASIFTVVLYIMLSTTAYAHAQQLVHEARPIEHTEQAALIPPTKMVAMPNAGGPGSYFYLSGKGFKAREQLGIYWGTASKVRYLGEAIADKQGIIAYAGFYTPLGLAPGRYSIVALRTDGKATMLSIAFRILAPKMLVGWLPGMAHALLLHMVNFAADEEILVTWNAASGQTLGSTISHYNGEAYFSVVPPQVAKGTYTITVRGQTSKLSVSEQLAFK